MLSIQEIKELVENTNKTTFIVELPNSISSEATHVQVEFGPEFSRQTIGSYDKASVTFTPELNFGEEMTQDQIMYRFEAALNLNQYSNPFLLVKSAR